MYLLLISKFTWPIMEQNRIHMYILVVVIHTCHVKKNNKKLRTKNYAPRPKRFPPARDRAESRMLE